ncbi:MAG: FHA domain-containing protein [Eubacteriales bacterium]|nr:FHA domain-containing protein [Eubacteriales bacterium]
MIFIIIGGIVLLICLLVLTVHLLKKQSKKKKLLNYFQTEYLNILKLSALDRAIVSPYESQSVINGPRKILVKLNEKSELTDKTYLLDMDEAWMIGRKPGKNTICIRGDKTVSSFHCMLRADNGVLYLVDAGSKNSTFYKPKRASASGGWYVPKKSAQPLTTGDSFIVGYTTFEVTVYDSAIGII